MPLQTASSTESVEPCPRFEQVAQVEGVGLQVHPTQVRETNPDIPVESMFPALVVSHPINEPELPFESDSSSPIQPDLPEPLSEGISVGDNREKTRLCSQCGAPMRLTSHSCRQCGARYYITIKGYCPVCQTMMEASADGKCDQCGGELDNPQVDSKLINIIETTPEHTTPVKTTSIPTQAAPKIHCPKCKSENPPNTDRCRNCDAKLLPAEGVGQRLAYFIAGILGAFVLGFLFYLFYIQNPGSAPDIAICDPIPLGLGALVVFFTGFIQALRKTPVYTKYENRAKRHISLNPWQALSDLNQAMEIAPAKEQGGLLKQRANIYEKIGLTEEAARDHLVLATSPDAFKGEGEWVAAFTGADSDTYTSSRRSDQITNLLRSGSARAVGYCSRCKKVVELDANQRCQTHPRTKGNEIQYVIPADLLVGKLTVLQKMESAHSQLSQQLTELLDTGQAKAVGYCPRCKAAVELGSKRRCTIHPRVKGRRIQYVLPNNIEAGKKLVLRGKREDKPVGRVRIIIVITLIFVSIGYFLSKYINQISEYAAKLFDRLP
ncbi:MAG: hypothetical protein A2Y88_05560 [Chloroflexi bacterium RBG_13_48_10]|nr:MAG: hypothetical protein A2Y88_05560 [Chloroflexi bacterium RBG_13_48_10]